MSERRFHCDEETFRFSCKNICHEMFDFPILFEVFGEYVFIYLLGYRYIFAVQLWSKRIAEQKWIWGLYHCLPAPTSCSSTVNFHRFRLQVGLVFCVLSDECKSRKRMEWKWAKTLLTGERKGDGALFIPFHPIPWCDSFGSGSNHMHWCVFRTVRSHLKQNEAEHFHPH